jgi:hypothetical protein
MPQVTQQDERGPLRVSRYSLAAPQTGPVMRLLGHAMVVVSMLRLLGHAMHGGGFNASPPWPCHAWWWLTIAGWSPPRRRGDGWMPCESSMTLTRRDSASRHALAEMTVGASRP